MGGETSVLFDIGLLRRSFNSQVTIAQLARRAPVLMRHASRAPPTASNASTARTALFAASPTRLSTTLARSESESCMRSHRLTALTAGMRHWLNILQQRCLLAVLFANLRRWRIPASVHSDVRYENSVCSAKLSVHAVLLNVRCCLCWLRTGQWSPLLARSLIVVISAGIVQC